MSLSSIVGTGSAKTVDPVPPGWPKIFRIIRYNVQAPVEAVAFNQARDVHAPFRWGDVAWYSHGARPGDVGRAVVYGHVDSLCCPAAFWDLKYLHRGDHITFTYKNRRTLTFSIQWEATYWNQQLPMKWIFHRTTDRGVVLITCAGVFRRNGAGYDHKLVAYATLVQGKKH